jgi:hypothetical protein
MNERGELRGESVLAYRNLGPLLSAHQHRQKRQGQLQLFQYPGESLDLLPLTICGILDP